LAKKAWTRLKSKHIEPHTFFFRFKQKEKNKIKEVESINVRDIHFIYFNVATNEFVPFFLLQVTCTAQPRSIIGGKRLEKEIGRKK
jgi:hypothetical protein